MARWRDPDIIRHCEIVADSFERLVGRPLVVPETGQSLADAMWNAPAAIVSHGVHDDPILNYGNRTALNLWRLDWETFTSTHSRQTTEPMHRGERARTLAEVAANSYVTDYTGVRITGAGRRFFIREAIIWNLLDENDIPYGQAATFDTWEWVGE